MNTGSARPNAGSLLCRVSGAMPHALRRRSLPTPWGGGVSYRRPPLDLTRGNLLGEILPSPLAAPSDGQHAWRRALTAGPPTGRRPSSLSGRLCHGYCVLQCVPPRKTYTHRSGDRLASCRAIAATRCVTPLATLVGLRWQRSMVSARVIPRAPPAAPSPPGGRPCQSPR